METKTQTVDLSNIKYAIAITGGGWSYEHTLYLVMNNGDAYITKDWKAKDIVPSNKVEAYHIGKLDVSKDFVVPSKLVTNCCDFCRVEVFDNTLSRAIYDAYGLEDEYSNYFGKLRKMSYDIELELKREEFRNYHQQREKERKLILKNENAYSNGKKMTADEFFAMSGMLLDNMDVPDKDVVYDPDGEYENLAKAMGGKVIKLNPSSNDCFNPFDIDDDGIEKEV